MAARKAAAALALAVLLAACGSAPRHHAVAPSTSLTPVTISAPPSPSPSPPPTCDISNWVAGNEPADEIDALRTDLQNLRQDLLNSQPVAAANAGHQLAEDAITYQNPPPPACAHKLRRAWRNMLLWYGIAGLAVFATEARPDLANEDYGRATRALRRADHYLTTVQAILNAENGS